MTRSARSLVLAAILPTLCACSTPTASRGAPRQAVTLRFAWPEQLSARVTHTVTMNSPMGNTQIQRSYWLTVAPTEEEGHRQLVSSDIEVSPPQFAAMVDPVPAVHFDDDGCFQGISTPENMPGLQLLEVLPMEPEKKAELLENLVAVQEEAALEYWDRLVASWRGVTLTPGEPVRHEAQIVVGTGFMEKKDVAAEERTSIEVGVPCTPDAQERRCVRLIVDLQPLGQSEAATGPMARKRFELVTDPDTLVPYSTRLTRMDRVDWGKDGGEQPLKEFLQLEEYVYTYGAQRVPPGTTSL
ncbi:hypothetical protein [Archangium violaceum]|uniref:hypothetical protein n=1 Tax=Archangium violaceum TaxID=83451 RepID=UPI0036DC9BE9